MVAAMGRALEMACHAADPGSIILPKNCAAMAACTIWMN